MNLTTLARVKTTLGVGGNGFDLELLNVIAGVSDAAAKYMRRQTQVMERTVYFSLWNSRRLYLSAWPVTSVASVKNDRDRDWNNVSPVDPSAYHVKSELGVLVLDTDRTAWVTGDDVLQVIYTGGMGTDTDDFISNYPSIAMAVEMQAVTFWRNRERLAHRGVSMPNGSVSLESPGDFLPAVEDILKRHRRRTV